MAKKKKPTPLQKARSKYESGRKSLVNLRYTEPGYSDMRAKLERIAKRQGIEPHNLKQIVEAAIDSADQ